MRDSNQITRRVVQVILHPLFMLSLLVLIINDHFLKAHHPSWLTGKLSDFAGLCVMVALLFAVLHRRIATNRHLLCLHWVVGLLFVIWKLAPIEGLLTAVNNLIGPYGFGRVRDAGDLTALLVLPFSYAVLRRGLVGQEELVPTRRIRRIAAALWLGAASFAVVATSIIPPYEIREARPLPRGTSPEAEILFRAEQTLARQGVHVLRRKTVTEGEYEYWIVCDTVIMCGPDSTKMKPREFRFAGTLNLNFMDTEVIHVGAVVGANCRIRYGDSWMKPVIDSVVAIRILRPVFEELAK